MRGSRSTLKTLRKECENLGLIKSGNYDQLSQRLHNHRSDIKSEYSRTAIVKRKAENVAKFDDIPIGIYFEPGQNLIIEHVPKYLWEKIFYYVNFCELMDLRLLCKYIYSAATSVLLKFSRDILQGKEDIYLFSFLKVLIVHELYKSRKALVPVLNPVFIIAQHYCFYRAAYKFSDACIIALDVYTKFNSFQGVIIKKNALKEKFKETNKKRKLNDTKRKERLNELNKQ